MLGSRSRTDKPFLLPQWILIPMVGFGMGFFLGAAFEGGAVQSFSSSSNVVIGFCEATVAGIVCAAEGASGAWWGGLLGVILAACVAIARPGHVVPALISAGVLAAPFSIVIGMSVVRVSIGVGYGIAGSVLVFLAIMWGIQRALCRSSAQPT